MSVDTTQTPEISVVAIGTTGQRHNVRFNRLELYRNYRVHHNLSHFENFFNLETELRRAFMSMVQPLVDEANSEDAVAITITNDQLYAPIFINTHRKKTGISPEIFINQIDRVSQSNRAFVMSGVFGVQVSITRELPTTRITRDRSSSPVAGPSWALDGRDTTETQLTQERRGPVTRKMTRERQNNYFEGAGANNNNDDRAGRLRRREREEAQKTAYKNASFLRKSRKEAQNVKKRSFLSSSVVTIGNRDKLCGFRAIIVGMFYSLWPGLASRYTAAIRNDYRKIQTKLAHRFCRLCGLEPNNNPLLTEGLLRKRVVNVCKRLGFRLVVVEGEGRDRLLYVTDSTNWNCRFIFIEHLSPSEMYPLGHYNTITKIDSYLRGNLHFCQRCAIVYRGTWTHQCPYACRWCGTTACYDLEGDRPVNTHLPSDAVKCRKCNYMFKNDFCYVKHLQNRRCRAIRRCDRCERRLPRWTNSEPVHECQVFFCHKCNQTYSVNNHICHMKPLKVESLTKNDKLPKVFIGYDIETKQEAREVDQQIPSTQDSCFYHEANLLCAMVSCDKCWDGGEDIRLEKNCDTCKTRILVYFGQKCVDDFVKYVLNELSLNVAKQKGTIHCFAHYATRFDSHFVLAAVLRQGFRTDLLLKDGMKLLRFDIKNVRFVDSYALFPLPLANLPKSFGFENKVVKGHWPHYFKKECHYNYISTQLPPIEFYGIDDVLPEKRMEIIDWY